MSLALEEEKLNLLQTELEEYEAQETTHASNYYASEAKVCYIYMCVCLCVY